MAERYHVVVLYCMVVRFHIMVGYHVMAGSHVVVGYCVWYSAMQLVPGYLLLF